MSQGISTEVVIDASTASELGTAPKRVDRHGSTAAASTLYPMSVWFLYRMPQQREVDRIFAKFEVKDARRISRSPLNDL